MTSSHPDRAGCLADVRRVLRPEGVLAVAETRRDSDFMALGALRTLVEERGFEFITKRSALAIRCVVPASHFLRPVIPGGRFMAVSVRLNHVAMSVPEGTLSDDFRREVLDFYGSLLGWKEIESLRLPDRLTLAVGPDCYVNIRERADEMTCSGYEHLGVVVRSGPDVEHLRDELVGRDIAVGDMTCGEDGYRCVRFQHLLPLAVEVQYFP